MGTCVNFSYRKIASVEFYREPQQRRICLSNLLEPQQSYFIDLLRWNEAKKKEEEKRIKNEWSVFTGSFVLSPHTHSIRPHYKMECDKQILLFDFLWNLASDLEWDEREKKAGSDEKKTLHENLLAHILFHFIEIFTDFGVK